MASFIVTHLAFAQTAPAPVPTPVEKTGMKLIDSTRNIEFSTPNKFWEINTSKFSISLNHNTHFDAHVTMKKSWYSDSTAKEAYDKRKASLKSYLPGAIFVKENEAVTLSGNISAVSTTYKNPSDLKIIREIFFIHKGMTYELIFQAKEENFPKIKEDFKYILQNLKLTP